MSDIKLTGLCVSRCGGCLDENKPALGFSDIFLGSFKKCTTDALPPIVTRYGFPVNVPGANGQRGWPVTDKPDYFFIVLGY